MSRTKNLILLLEGLEKSEFDKIVKIYLKYEYGFEKIIFTDGTGDGGLDIKVFDFEEDKLQYQLTTQKSATQAEKSSFERKLKADLEKAKSNCKEHSYKDKLIFFYSKTLTNDKINNYQTTAYKVHKINLEIIDANRLAQEAENIIELQSELYKKNELDKFKVQSTSFDNSQENLMFELLSFGKPTEFKVQIIESFVLQSFFIKGKLSKQAIEKLCEEKFAVKENPIFYERFIGQLLTDKKILKDIDNVSYVLSKEQLSLLKLKNEQFELDKKIFTKEIYDILDKYHQSAYIEDFIRELKKLYIENFSSDLNSLDTDYDDEQTFFKLPKDFTKFIENKLRDKKKSSLLSKELLKFCLNNKFIQKIAASKVYCHNINSNKLTIYLNTKKKFFIDTPIALHGLCYFYKPKTEYPFYYYKVCKHLIEFFRKEGLNLFMSHRYIHEIADHVKDAFKLVPFTNIPTFNKLGSSGNVFYNYFKYLKKSNTLDEDINFGDFLHQFGFSETGGYKSAASVIENLLENIGIIKEEIKDYSLEEANKIFDKALVKNNKVKGQFTKTNDSIMLEFLSDNDVDVHPLEPVFITWDKTFLDAHIEYRKKFPASQNWLIVSPNKLIDVYSLLKFSINSETVTENILALISDDIISNTHSLIDTLAIILNPNDEIGLEYTTKLAEIRESEITSISINEKVPIENIEGAVTTIDDVLFSITSHYQNKEGKLDLFKNVFTKKELITQVIGIILRAIKEFSEEKKLSKDIFEEFDNLIRKVNSEEK